MYNRGGFSPAVSDPNFIKTLVERDKDKDQNTKSIYGVSMKDNVEGIESETGQYIAGIKE
jgi:hypothetical protein